MDTSKYVLDPISENETPVSSRGASKGWLQDGASTEVMVQCIQDGCKTETQQAMQHYDIISKLMPHVMLAVRIELDGMWEKITKEFVHIDSTMNDVRMEVQSEVVTRVQAEEDIHAKLADMTKTQEAYAAAMKDVATSMKERLQKVEESSSMIDRSESKMKQGTLSDSPPVTYNTHDYQCSVPTTSAVDSRRSTDASLKNSPRMTQRSISPVPSNGKALVLSLDAMTPNRCEGSDLSMPEQFSCMMQQQDADEQDQQGHQGPGCKVSFHASLSGISRLGTAFNTPSASALTTPRVSALPSVVATPRMLSPRRTASPTRVTRFLTMPPQRTPRSSFGEASMSKMVTGQGVVERLSSSPAHVLVQGELDAIAECTDGPTAPDALIATMREVPRSMHTLANCKSAPALPAVATCPAGQKNSTCGGDDVDSNKIDKEPRHAVPTPRQTGQMLSLRPSASAACLVARPLSPVKSVGVHAMQRQTPIQTPRMPATNRALVLPATAGAPVAFSVNHSWTPTRTQSPVVQCRRG